MAMRLVRKKVPRGRLIRSLSEAEESAVKKVCGRREGGCPEAKAVAENVLTEMRRSDAWLACSCVAGEAPPMNSANLRSDIRVDKSWDLPLLHVVEDFPQEPVCSFAITAWG